MWRFAAATPVALQGTTYTHPRYAFGDDSIFLGYGSNGYVAGRLGGVVMSALIALLMLIAGQPAGSVHPASGGIPTTPPPSGPSK